MADNIQQHLAKSGDMLTDQSLGLYSHNFLIYD